ncbi:MAG: hypothetical protein HYV77_00670 [Candidatus Wildermuthbacteria bacterium]|nr:hypothetical protein [Candidatus Wildermuthbacteria bacterium]
MLELVKVAATPLSVVSSALILLSFTKLGKMKVFRFMLGEIALMTAIAYTFKTALGVSAFAPFGMAIWFAFSSINFAYATWCITEQARTR